MTTFEQIEYIAKKAREEGMSYGEYVKRYGEKIEIPVSIKYAEHVENPSYHRF